MIQLQFTTWSVHIITDTRQLIAKIGFFTALLATLIWISGCAPATMKVERDIVQFKGDTQPKVHSSAALSGDLSNLSEGETLIIAVAKDGSSTLSQPTLAKVNIEETILQSSHYNRDTLMKECDPDGDGILDSYCPDLVSAFNKGKLENEQFVTFQSWYLVEKKLNDDDYVSHEDYWKDSTTINITEAETSEILVYLKMLTVNRGNIPFSGDLTVFAKVPPQMKLKEITEVDKVEDLTKIKRAFDPIPIVNIIIDALDNYSVVPSLGVFQHEITEQGNIKVTAKDITLKPGEGINLEYTVIYPVIQ